MDSIYAVGAGADVALAAATAKSVLGVRAPANAGLIIVRAGVAFDAGGAGVGERESVLVELCQATFASNAPGTNSTSETPVIWRGKPLTVGATAASNWTAEPTVLSVIDEFLIHPQSGFKEWYPLGYEPSSPGLNEGFVLRCTAPDAVNCRPSLLFARG